MSDSTWSVHVGTQWLLVRAPHEQAAKLVALRRAGYGGIQRIVDHTAPSGLRLVPRDPAVLDRVVATVATPEEIEQFEQLSRATFMKGGAQARLKALL